MIIFPGFLASIFTKISSGISSLWRENTILSSSVQASNMEFGRSVAINSTGDRIIVGVPRTDTSALDDGAVFIFNSGTNGWTIQQTLTGSLATSSNDNFGYSVAINSIGDRIIVGAYRDERAGQSSNQNEGLAYIFVSGNNGWVEQAILSGTHPTINDHFGWSVTMNSNGTRVAIGAPNDNRSSGGGTAEGLVHVFISGAMGWNRDSFNGSTQPIYPDGASANSRRFGHSVAMNSSGDYIIVGMPSDNSSLGEVNFLTRDSFGWNNAGFFLDTFNSDNYVSGISQSLGSSVAVNSDATRFVVGAPGSLNEPLTRGKVIIFERNGTTLIRRVLSSSYDFGSFNDGDGFGRVVSISSNGNVVFVTSESDFSGLDYNRGSVSIYSSGTNGWAKNEEFSGSKIGNSDYFGSSISVNSTGNRIVIGAPFDEPSGFSFSFNSGLAYVFVSGS